ncbi:hypothetical protein JOC85_000293 [Bacillus mesophilus]|uniref:DUF3055 domain-containing protein n=1 Tax=Bacillus mesophilus TaxID=1808955 RepID=A0A6M0Q3R0_9BACI|nr:DUF3055 domain-containing protein [Bacillus mesophilus]MBM7659526.1 hypothetical protein [Bacillus mesophilus]NEY70399.1 DUF3055 domain-containing protein [Bacillus mesophilus]
MNYFERLYDENETAKVRFVGFTTDDVRYDFGLVYTNMFFGKPLAICMQTGRSALLDPQDIQNIETLQQTFKIRSFKEAEDLAEFFKETIPSASFETQYE